MENTPTIGALVARARQQLAETTGLKPVGITRVFQDDQGWHVGVELLELARIPTATDVLGAYEVLLTADGSMVRFERKRTRLRGEPLEEPGEG